MGKSLHVSPHFKANSWIGPKGEAENARSRYSKKFTPAFNKRFNAFMKKQEKEWTRILKDDNDFDGDTIIRILKYKIERVRKRISFVKLVADEKTITAEMRQAEQLLQKVIDDNYEEEVFSKLEKRYGKRSLYFPDGTKVCNYKHDKWKAFPSFKFKSELKMNDKELMEMQEIKNRAYEEADEKKKADLKKAFDLISDKIWSWWE